MELAGIDGAAAKWDKAVEIAVRAEELGYDSIWVYDHFHNVPRPAHEAVFECWTTMAAISQRTSTDPPRPDGRLQRLPQPGAAGQDHVDDRRHQRRPARLGHRRRLVRERVPRLRLRRSRSRRTASGCCARRVEIVRSHVDASRRRRTTGEYYELVARQLRSEAAAAAAPADLDRRRRRAADAARRRPPRRLLATSAASPTSGRASATILQGPLRRRRSRRGRRSARRGRRRCSSARPRPRSPPPARAACGASRSTTWRADNLVGTPEQVAREDPARTSTSAAPASSRGAPTTPSTETLELLRHRGDARTSAEEARSVSERPSVGRSGSVRWPSRSILGAFADDGRRRTRPRPRRSWPNG